MILQLENLKASMQGYRDLVKGKVPKMPEKRIPFCSVDETETAIHVNANGPSVNLNANVALTATPTATDPTRIVSCVEPLHVLQRLDLTIKNPPEQKQ
jgi:hypothetical protein